MWKKKVFLSVSLTNPNKCVPSFAFYPFSTHNKWYLIPQKEVPGKENTRIKEEENCTPKNSFTSLV